MDNQLETLSIPILQFNLALNSLLKGLAQSTSEVAEVVRKKTFGKCESLRGLTFADFDGDEWGVEETQMSMKMSFSCSPIEVKRELNILAELIVGKVFE